MTEFPIILKGERIELRTVKPTFLNAKIIFDVVVASREHLLPWLEWASIEDTKAPEDSFEFLQKVAQTREEKTQYAFGIFLGEKYIGNIGVFGISNRHKSAEIGYWIAKDQVGKGYMTEAVKVLENAAFSQIDLNRIQILCDPRNAASANVAKRAGYAYEGTMREEKFNTVDKQFVDRMTFSKLRVEWEAENKKDQS